jgi:hypothetical protein
VPFFWKKTLKEVPGTFNARVETIADKPMFREAFQWRRCIIPASGFCEWTGEKRDKQPHVFTASDGSPILAFAGLWDRCRDPASGEEILSCTIIVSRASQWMMPFHDRMPGLLHANALGPTAEDDYVIRYTTKVCPERSTDSAQRGDRGNGFGDRQLHGRTCHSGEGTRQWRGRRQ